MDESAERTNVEWREWGGEAFAEARRTGRPVLLSLSAHWCGWCRHMDETAYSDPGVAANINDGFVPVRVDADRRPRVRERYHVGGFPSTVFLTPDGEMLSGATLLDADGLRQVLDRVREAWDERGDDAGQIPRALRETETPGSEDVAAVENHVAGQLVSQYDADHAGWGTDAKFPLPRTVEFALKRERTRALATLDAVASALFDDVDGGFYRYATERDWSEPQHEKLLDSNAALVRAYANAYLHTGDETYLEVAERTVDYFVGTLWSGEAFGGSQAPGEYYALSPAERAAADEPAVDDTAFADRNALAAEALLALTAYTDDDRTRRYAERTLEFLRTDLVADGVVDHFPGEDSPSGLLADHARVASAFATAAQVLDPDYLDTARRVADRALDRLRETPTDGAGRAFVDAVPEAVGLLDRPLRPLDDNAAMANALVDLGALTGDRRYVDAGRDAVRAFAGAADRLGVQVAEYATAAARVARPPLRVAVATDPGTDLHRAALRIADHEKVVLPAAHERDDETFERGCAYVLVPDGDVVPAATPDELVARVAEVVDA